MSRSKAVRSGFSFAFRNPAVVFAEVAWRWAFGGAALLISAYALLLFLKSVPVANRDLLGLSEFIPGQVFASIKHILAGRGPQIIRILAVLALGLSIVWWLVGSLGRSVTLGAFAYSKSSSIFSKQLIINILRLIIFWMTLAALASCFYLIGKTTTSSVDALGSPGTPVLDFFAVVLAALILWLFTSISWYLTQIGLLSAYGDWNLGQSMQAAMDLSGRQFLQYFWVGFVFGVFRLILLTTTIFFGFALVGILAGMSGWLILFAIGLVGLAYFAVAEFFATARLAAYVRIVHWDSYEARQPAASNLSGTTPIPSGLTAS